MLKRWRQNTNKRKEWRLTKIKSDITISFCVIKKYIRNILNRFLVLNYLFIWTFALGRVESSSWTTYCLQPKKYLSKYSFQGNLDTSKQNISLSLSDKRDQSFLTFLLQKSKSLLRKYALLDCDLSIFLTTLPNLRVDDAWKYSKSGSIIYTH